MPTGEVNGDEGFVLLGDQPHEGRKDPLGFEHLVEDLRKLILASRDSTPFTLGIEAPWGTGKSTLMTLLRARLAETEAVTPVQFSAWTADNGGALEGLVKTVLNELDANALRRAMRNEKLMSGLRVAVSIAAGFIGMGNAADAVWDRVASDPRARNELRGLVDQAVSAWRNERAEIPRQRTLCVFIDDLDRCSPEGVLDVFEAMKLYLDVPGIVFVIGYDQDIVSDLVLRRKGYGDAVSSRDYIEKFIQIVYRIPRPAADRAEALIASLLETSGTNELFGPNERALVIEGSASNPRRVKRFINGFVLAYGLDSRWRKFDPQGLIRVQLLQMYFRDFARMLERTSERDPIEEFLEYRAAHDALRRQDPSPEAWAQVTKALAGQGLAVPEQEGSDFEALLRRLEENAPVAFKPLAEREDFATLVESIAAGDDWPALRMALAEGALPSIASEIDGKGNADDQEWPFDALRVLWVDDEMTQNMGLVSTLTEGGAEVTLVSTTEEMLRELEARKFDVLISDIARPGNMEEGLDVAERLIDDNSSPPPMLFYTARVTEARRKRAAELEVPLVTEPDRVLALLQMMGDLKRGVEASKEDERPVPSPSWSSRWPEPL